MGQQLTPIPRVFVDTSVLFAAIYSSKGHARDLINLGVDESVTIVISQTVILEVERNILKKRPALLPAFQLLMVELQAEIVSELSIEQIKHVEEYTVAKDATIVAAAISAKVDYLVTYDRKHLIDPPEVAAKSGLAIVTPEVVIERLRGSSS